VAADLAVFHILLERTRGLVDIGGVPLSAIAALEVTFHSKMPQPQFIGEGSLFLIPNFKTGIVPI
jgi:hypothetical protein